MKTELIIIIGEDRTIAGTSEHAVLFHIQLQHLSEMRQSVSERESGTVGGSYGVVTVIAVVEQRLWQRIDNAARCERACRHPTIVHQGLSPRSV